MVKITEKVIILCEGTTCIHADSKKIQNALESELNARGIADQVTIKLSGCLGMCDKGPVMIVNPGYTIYGNVKVENVADIVDKHLINDDPIGELVVQENNLFNKFYRVFGDVGFFGKQMRITLRNCGIIDPESIEEYMSLRGYEAVAKVLTDMSPEDVVKEVKESGLRGRGGGGFPTGLKWELTAKEINEEKYIVCNADEGDPGAFMDRSAIEGDPHSIIEGMIIGGYAINASNGIVYIRAEYPLAIKRLQKAIDDAKANGFLGKNIMGSDFSFDLRLCIGAGAFVCGEETALIHSIEGKRGIPRQKPPFPSVRGVFDKPSMINNVETMANIPVIILDGAKWFSSVGTENSKGTKVFALAGNVHNAGLIEVPMGTTLREIIYDIGGGITGGKEFKAVQTGGPSGGCLPKEFLDTPIDYDSLAKAGSIMGSGGMIVMDDATCMVSIAKFFLEFTMDESCGKCVPCRVGTKRMYQILESICNGDGKEGDIEELETLAKSIKVSSLCGLGQTAPNPVLSTIERFREEYEEHINDKKCRAGECKALLQYTINDKCIGCGACKRACPVDAIYGKVKELHTIDQDECIKCGQCVDTCKFKAIDNC